MMKDRPIVKISFGILLLIAVVGTVLTVLNKDDQYSSLIYAIVMLYGVGIEVTVLMLLGVFHLFKGRIIARDVGKMPTNNEAWNAQQEKRRALGKEYLLSAGLVLLVGFSTCLGGAYLMAEML